MDCLGLHRFVLVSHQTQVAYCISDCDIKYDIWKVTDDIEFKLMNPT